MFLTKLKLIAGVLLTVSVLTLGAGLWTQHAQADKEAPDAVPELVGRGCQFPSCAGGYGCPLGHPGRRGTAKSSPTATRPPPGGFARPGSRTPGQGPKPGPGGNRRHRQSRRKGRSTLTGWFGRFAADQVRKGQLLAVVWSKEVGEKKGELVDALLRLRQDHAILAKLEEAYKQGAIPEVTFLQAQRNVQADQNAIAHVERTSATMATVGGGNQSGQRRGRSDHRAQGKHHEETEKNWARIEIHAPLDGTIVEKNFAVGEVLNNQTIDLVKIANLDRLIVLVSVAEADLAALLAQLSGSRKWTVQPVGGPPIEAEMDEIGHLIDPNQRTAIVKGYIDNPGHKLRAGQFITVSIVLPVPVREMAVPAAAVVDEGKASYVFVQSDPKQFVYRQHRVLVVRRGQDVIHIRSPLTADEERQGFQSLRAGERILTGGVVELKATLDDLKTKAKR